MAASFIRRKAAIMCHYPWAMIFLPLPRVVFFCFFSLLLSFKQHLDIYSEKKSHSQQQNNWGDGFPLHGYKMKAKQTLSSLPARREGGPPSGPRSDARALRGRAAPPRPGEELGTRSLVLGFAHSPGRAGRIFGAQGVSVHAPSPAVTPLTVPMLHSEEFPVHIWAFGEDFPGLPARAAGAL